MASPLRAPVEATVRLAIVQQRVVRQWTRRVPALLRKAKTALLLTGAAGCITAAAWSVALPLGLLVAGLSLGFLEYMSDGERR